VLAAARAERCGAASHGARPSARRTAWLAQADFTDPTRPSERDRRTLSGTNAVELITLGQKRPRWSTGTLGRCVAGIILLIALIAARSSAAQDSLFAARDLYNAAAYEDALTQLNRLRASAHGADDARYIEQYRAFCLLALGRTTEAEHAIEAVVTAAPLFRPSDADVSPRVRSAFRDVRRRMLPDIIQRKYAEAKAAFDSKDRAAARDGFTQVLELLADTDVTSGSQPPLSELRTLAVGFRDLSAAPAPAPQPVTLARPPPAEPLLPATPLPSPRPAESRPYGPSDKNVVPPVVVRQSFAALADVFALRPGIVEIIIDETGAVEAATIVVPVNPVYDRLALAMAKNWRYKPATVNGAPVKFRRIVQLDLKASR
jgi:TonB family protein